MSTERPDSGSAAASPYVPEAPAAPRPYRDLCSTCRHQEACGSRSTPERPILFCEMFEALGAKPAAARPAAADAGAAASGQGAARHIGLCANCESRQTCTMARPEGGVWHCEEYR